MSEISRTAGLAAVLAVLTLTSLPVASLAAAGAADPTGDPAPSPTPTPTPASASSPDAVELASQSDANGTTAAENGSGATTTAGDGSDAAATPGGDTDAGDGGGSDAGGENGTAAEAGAVDAYDGAHVSVGVETAAVTDYAVDGRAYFESIAVQSRTGVSDAGSVGVGSSPTGLAGLSGANLSVASRSTAALTLRSERGASLSIHDNEHGIVVIRATRGTQYVRMNVSENAEANYEGDSQVVATTEEREDASVTVVGNGSLGLDDEGNAVAELGPDGLLVVRAYEGKRGSDDRKQEAFIGDGVATGEVYVMDRPNGTVVDTIAYENETSLNATAGAETVNLTVERTQRQGAVVFTSVDATLADPNSDVQVVVDGEPASIARTYAQLRVAANNGPEPRYKVSQSTQGGAAADIAVAINRFPAGESRGVTIRSVEAVGGNGTTDAETTSATSTTTAATGTPTAETTGAPPANATGTTTPGGTPTSATSPGFGIVAALTGLVGLLAGSLGRRAARRR